MTEHKRKDWKLLYVFLMGLVLSITTIGTTYAYWTATANSTSKEVKTESTIFKISMDITPLYSDFSFIPMNDGDALKALKKECRDKYGRGACSAYTIKVYDYNQDLGYISGYMDVNTNNITNLSYMLFRHGDTYDEDSCVMLDDGSYCMVREATPVGEGKNLSLGDSYDISGMDDTKFILLIWLTNFDYSQNADDIGTFDAIITMQAGSGGEIKGTISNRVEVESEKAE